MEKKVSKEHLARSKRVWSLRQLTGLSRREFTKRYGIAAGTLQNWEDAQGNGLSEKGAFRLVKTLQASGIYCGIEWLMHGIGEPPHMAEPLPTTTTTHLLAKKGSAPDDDYEHVVLKAELQLFCSHYPEAIFLQLNDDSMLPLYQPYEYVAGVRAYQNDINALVGQNCIVLLTTGEQLLRHLRHSTIPGLYDLAALNPETTTVKSYYYDVSLVYAAPVIWSRRLREA